MISVEAALERLFALAAPLAAERVALGQAHGRVLAAPAVANRPQPPFDASAMDGYACRAADTDPAAVLDVIGRSAAGARFDGRVGPGEAVRIFTGAPLPDGADTVVIQEEAQAAGGRVTLAAATAADAHIRRKGTDFAAGARLPAGRKLRPADIALLAAMDVAEVAVTRRPVVAIVPTGDELVPPGGDPGPDQIIASAGYGLAAMFAAEGAVPRLLPIAPDTEAALADTLALASDADLIVTTGGASVGDHDLIARSGAKLGIERDFYKIAMRPGKPLIAGRIGPTAFVGLPGNPVSAMVCATIFLRPMLAVMTGLPARPAAEAQVPLAAPLPANGPRRHYMRARLGPEGASAFHSQDSSLLSVLAEARALIVRPPHAPAAIAGETVSIIRL